MIINVLKLIVITGVAFVLGQLLIDPRPMLVGAALLLVFLPVFILRPHIYFLAFIILRPLLDITIRGGATETNLSALAVVPLIALCVKDIIFNRLHFERIVNNPFLKGFNAFFLIFIVTALLSLFNTEDLKVSAADFLRLLSLMIAVNYAVVYFGEDRQGLKRLVKYIFISALIPVGFGIYQLATGMGIPERGFNRIYGTFAHSNVFAEYLFLALFLLIFMIARPAGYRPVQKFGLIVLLCLTGLCFYHTYTRTLWVAFALSLFFYIVMQRRFVKKAVYLVLACTLVFLCYGKIVDRFTFQGTKHEGRSSWEWRTDLWGEVAEKINRHPVTGHGLGMLEHEIDAMAHNDFLRLSYETGIPGAVIFYGMFIYILFFCASRFFKTKHVYDKERSSLAFCLTLGLLIASMAVNTLRSTVIMFYFLITIALLLQFQRSPSYESSFNQ